MSTDYRSDASPDDAGSGRDFTVVLILSGGNALGAYQAGAYQALAEAGIDPDWVIGTSAGAVNGALIAGNAREERLERLAAFWRPDAGASDAARPPLWEPFETMRRSAAAQWTLLTGRPGVFGPALSGMRWPPGGGGDQAPGLFDTRSLASSLQRLVDFGRLNGSQTRFTCTAVDLESGEDVIFDTTSGTIAENHIRASAALPVAFPSVEVSGRWLADGGLSANLALDPFFAQPPDGRTLCIAIDLLPLQGARPRTLGEAAIRMQDILFAGQSRRSIARWTEHYRHLPTAQSPSILFARLAYQGRGLEIAGKAMDFSPSTIGDRWRAGHAEMQRMLGEIDDGLGKLDTPGLHQVSLSPGGQAS